MKDFLRRLIAIGILAGAAIAFTGCDTNEVADEEVADEAVENEVEEVD